MASIARVTTALADVGRAESLARAAVDAHRAACVQLTPIHSVYRWAGAVEAASEVLVVFKTSLAGAEALRAFIEAQHPYELPEILVETVEASDSYSAWVRAQVAE